MDDLNQQQLVSSILKNPNFNQRFGAWEDGPYGTSAPRGYFSLREDYPIVSNPNVSSSDLENIFSTDTNSHFRF